jgi:hypothetical protein
MGCNPEVLGCVDAAPFHPPDNTGYGLHARSDSSDGHHILTSACRKLVAKP